MLEPEAPSTWKALEDEPAAKKTVKFPLAERKLLEPIHRELADIRPLAPSSRMFVIVGSAKRVKLPFGNTLKLPAPTRRSEMLKMSAEGSYKNFDPTAKVPPLRTDISPEFTENLPFLSSSEALLLLAL
jgi:hypothetical protein